MAAKPLKVLIAGGGVAALEALIALRSLAEERVDIELLTPTPYFEYRPLAVAEPFGLGNVTRYDLGRIAGDHGASLQLAGVQSVDGVARRVITEDGGSVGFDVLLLGVGARATTSIPGSVTIQGHAYTGRFRTVLRELESHRTTRLAFAVPGGASWPLPVYELALLTAAHVAERGLRKVQLSLVTPEARPLELFGARASEAVEGMLRDGGVDLHTSCYPTEFRDGELGLVPTGGISVERVVSFPRLRGPDVAGVPADAEGFLPVDLHGLVAGEADIYAAGDATNGAIKQGGIAAQQADAAAEAIAARAGAPLEPTPFRPVLRGLLLTGAIPRYMRAEVSGGRGEDWEVSERPLWWPPGKIAGRYLAPYLALSHKEVEQVPGGLAVDVELAHPGAAAPSPRRVS